MILCGECGNAQVRVGAQYCDECGGRLPPQVGVDPEATLKPEAARRLKREQRAAAAAAAAAGDDLPFVAGEGPQTVTDTASIRRAPSADKKADKKAGKKTGKKTKRKARATVKAQDPPPWARGIGWEAWSAAGPMPQRVRVDGAEWAQVDQIFMRQRESEELHAWSFQGGKVMRERHAQRYPGGSAIETRGYRHDGGSARFRILGLTPDAPVTIIRQVWALGREHAEVKIDNKSCVRIRESEVDPRSALRNRAVVLSPTVVTRAELDVEVVDTGGEQGLNWFHVWVFQPAEVAHAGTTEPGEVLERAGDGPSYREWSQLRTTSRDLPSTLQVAGDRWRLVDEVSFSDEDSMSQHAFAVVDSQDSYAAFELALEFPDGVKRHERGVRFKHGEATWEVSGLTAGKEIMMVLRTDVHQSGQAFDLSVGGQGSGRVRITDRSPTQRGRHWEAPVRGALVTSDTVRFRASVSDPGKGISLFGLWFYQPS